MCKSSELENIFQDLEMYVDITNVPNMYTKQQTLTNMFKSGSPECVSSSHLL